VRLCARKVELRETDHDIERVVQKTGCERKKNDLKKIRKVHEREEVEKRDKETNTERKRSREKLREKGIKRCNEYFAEQMNTEI